MEKKTRKPAERDPIRQSLRHYRRKIEAAHREIDELAQRGENRKVSTPNYVLEVIAPLARLIHEKLPVSGLVLGEKVERQTAKEAYYRLRAEGMTIGGFSYPGAGAGHIDFTIFAHDKPWGRVFRISDTRQLIKILGRLMAHLELETNNTTDVLR